MSSENVERQDLRRLVGTKSMGEDLSMKLERSLRTSLLVTEGMKSTEAGVIGSGNSGKLPQWGVGQSPSRQTIWCISEPKGAALVATVFVHFHKNKF